MNKLRNILTQLLLTKRQLDIAVENLPSSVQKSNILSSRKRLNEYFEKDILAKWKRLASLLNIDADIEVGVQYLSDFKTDPASTILSSSLYINAFDCLNRYGKLVSQSMQLSTQMKNVANRHALAGFFDYFSEATVSDMDRGTTAMRYFYDRAITYENSALPKTFDEFIIMVNAKSPALVDGLGGTINSIDQDIGYTDHQVQGVMELLADNGEGNLPANFGTFQMSVGKSASDPSFWKSVRYALTDTTKTVAEGLQEGGSAALEALGYSKGILKYLPFILLGAGGLAVLYYMPRKVWK